MRTTTWPELSADKQVQVAQLFRDHIGAVPETLNLLHGGLSGAAVYKATVSGKDYILKLDQSGTEQTRQNAYDCAGIAAAAGMAPELYYADAAAGISVSACIPQVPLRSLPPAELAALLGSGIRNMHSMPLFSKQQDMRATVDALVATFTEDSSLQGPLYKEAITLYSDLRAAYPWHDPYKVSSHNDLNPNNLLYDGRQLWIIDWDAAFANDPYTDLATACNFFAATPELESMLLKAYFGTEPDQGQRARCFVMQQMCRLIYALLMFRTAGPAIPALLEELPELPAFTMSDFGTLMQRGQINLGSAKGQLLYGQALLHQAGQQMRSQRFREALPQLQHTLQPITNNVR